MLAAGRTLPQCTAKPRKAHTPQVARCSSAHPWQQRHNNLTTIMAISQILTGRPKKEMSNPKREVDRGWDGFCEVTDLNGSYFGG